MSVPAFCQNCAHGHKFTPRADEIAMYGEKVMGCKKPNYEGYTSINGTCPFFRPAPEASQ